MAKSEIYSWRMAPELKQSLEDEARRAGESLACLLQEIAEDWLRHRHRAARNEKNAEDRIRAEVMKLSGAVRGGDARRSTRARDALRDRLRKMRAR